MLLEWFGLWEEVNLLLIAMKKNLESDLEKYRKYRWKFRVLI